MIVVVRAVAGTAAFIFVIEVLVALVAVAPATTWDTTTIMRFVIPGIAACGAGAWAFIDWESARHEAERRAMTPEQRADWDNDRAW